MPAIAIPVSVSVSVPEFFSVTACAVDTFPGAVAANVKLVTLSVTGGAAVPVPVNDTVCGEPLALSVTLRVPVSAAAELG